MIIKVYNIETGEYFRLDEDIEVIALVLDEEIEKRKWASLDCRIEVLDYE